MADVFKYQRRRRLAAETRKTKHGSGFVSDFETFSAIDCSPLNGVERTHAALFLPENNKTRTGRASAFGLKPKVGKLPRIRSLPTRMDDRVAAPATASVGVKTVLSREESLNCAI
jgi:hypothetical protein